MDPTQQTILDLLIAATLAPLASALLVIFCGKSVLRQTAGWFATAVMGGALVCCLYAAKLWTDQSQPMAIVWNLPWVPTPGTAGHWLYLGAMIDGLTIAMMILVSSISLLVHLYSIGYMAGDSRFARFFAYLSLFSFSMFGIVMSQSLIEVLIFWELVGLTSYLLIGFWFEKRGPQLACKKAFVMNRIGDVGFLSGFGILFYHLGGRVLLPAATGGLDALGHRLPTMLELITSPTAAGGLGLNLAHPPLWLTLAGIGLFCGAIGKSAQFPLHTWLPDAMEGPTPVSSIVHSATMVAAGVYLTARIYGILTPSAHLFIAIIGLTTLVIAALMAMVMTDIKRVLAYSTLSQLGYMILGLAVGSWGFALYHLITHAFFKCCLFQCAGSVILASHHEQDMRSYGGLWRKMPVTSACYLVCTLAISGASIPFTEWGLSGFYSKDGIIAGAFNYSHAMTGAGWPMGAIFAFGPVLVAYITAFYMARSFALTFLGKPRDQHLFEHAQEAPWTMWGPQLVLAAMSVLAVILPFKDLISQTDQVALVHQGQWLQSIAAIESGGPSGAPSLGMEMTHIYLAHGLGWLVVLAIGLALYWRGLALPTRLAGLPILRVLHTWFREKFYFDALYDIFVVQLVKALSFSAGAFDEYVVDGLVNAAGVLGKVSAMVAGLFDNAIVDGLVNGAANLAQGAGDALRATQVGRVRAYVLLMFASAALVGAGVLALILVHS